jgi:hypothetical protein
LWLRVDFPAGGSEWGIGCDSLAVVLVRADRRGKTRARGGLEPGNTGLRGNKRNPARSGQCTSQSDSQSVDNVHTPLLPVLTGLMRHQMPGSPRRKILRFSAAARSTPYPHSPEDQISVVVDPWFVDPCVTGPAAWWHTLKSQPVQSALSCRKGRGQPLRHVQTSSRRSRRFSRRSLPRSRGGSVQ